VIRTWYLALGVTVVTLTGGCGLLVPDIECRNIDRDPCTRAVDIATSQVDPRVGPASWFESPGPSRVLVEPGCSVMSMGCPSVVHATMVTVTFYGPGDEDPIHARVRRSEVGLPEA